MSFSIRHFIYALLCDPDPWFSLMAEMRRFNDRFPDATPGEVLYAADLFCQARPDLRRLL